MVGLPEVQGLPEPAFVPPGDVPGPGAAAVTPPPDRRRRDGPGAGDAGEGEGRPAGVRGGGGGQRARGVGPGGVGDVPGLGGEGEETLFVQEEEEEGGHDAKVGGGDRPVGVGVVIGDDRCCWCW